MRNMIFLLSFLTFASSAFAEVCGVNPYGPLKYQSGFTHLTQANPDAPKGGRLRRATLDEFDSLDPYYWNKNFQTKTAPLINYLYFETLLESSLDSDGAAYCLLVERIEWAQDFTSVTLHIQPEAKFNNGEDVTAKDVLFSYETIRKSHPFYDKQVFSAVVSAEVVGFKTIRFDLKVRGEIEAKKTLVALGDIYVFHRASAESLPQEQWKGNVRPVGSGPYTIEEFIPNKKISYTRRKDYWGKDIPVRKGRFNFDRVEMEYYMNETVARMSFQKSEGLNYWRESDSQMWTTVRELPNTDIFEKKVMSPSGARFILFNNQKAKFKDRRVRKALALALDYEQINRLLYGGEYTATTSFFQNTVYAHQSEISAEERQILEQYGDRISPDALRAQPLEELRSAKTAREKLRMSLDLLAQAGWHLKGTRLVNAEGAPFTLKGIYFSDSQEALFEFYKASLRKIGIELETRLFDHSSAVHLIRSGDYDLRTSYVPGRSVPPIEDLEAFFKSDFADDPTNMASIEVKNPVLDELIERYKNATLSSEVLTLARVIDRVVLAENYVIPTGQSLVVRLSFRSGLKFVDERDPRSETDPIGTWWSEDAK